MKKGNSEPLSAALRAELIALEATPDSAIDTSDMPEVLDWSGARRGLFYRPRKVQKALRIDADVVAWFGAQGPGHLSRMNRTLRGACLRIYGGGVERGRWVFVSGAAWCGRDAGEAVGGRGIESSWPTLLRGLGGGATLGGSVVAVPLMPISATSEGHHGWLSNDPVPRSMQRDRALPLYGE